MGQTPAGRGARRAVGHAIPAPGGGAPGGAPSLGEEGNLVAGAIDVAAAALSGGLATIEAMHAAIARQPFGALRVSPMTAVPAAGVRVVHDGITRLVYALVRGALEAGGGALRAAAALAPPVAGPRPGSSADLAIAALNGFAGERLVDARNPLATAMGLRVDGRPVAAERSALSAAYPGATSRVAVFVHGLACGESMWRIHAARHYGDARTTYGSRLQADLGYTPLYVRYNSGRHISQNGRDLAALLERVAGEWPVAVDEVVLVGHSMGGLVVRAACHYGEQDQRAWLRALRHVFLLGSPHAGAPLEKVANLTAWLLGLHEITRPLARALNARSAGVKDLRYGAVLDEHWRDTDVDELLRDRTGNVPLVAGANHYFVAATVTRDARHPLGRVIGDLLVREGSACGRNRLRRIQFPLEHSRRFGPMNHFELLNHPDVYEQMRRWLAT